MKSEEDGLIDQIEEIRKVNNKAWMDLLRIAMKAAPGLAKRELRTIVDGDRHIAEIMTRLAK